MGNNTVIPIKKLYSDSLWNWSRLDWYWRRKRLWNRRFLFGHICQSLYCILNMNTQFRQYVQDRTQTR